MTAQREAYILLDGRDFKQMVNAALVWLRQHQATVNALNVFPVPDGDTGTNMVLTMVSAWKEIADLQDDHVGRVAGRVAHGALMGARGNSGVILSQIWRGMARSLAEKSQMRAEDFAAAMQEASQTAYKGVVKPVEGTILTVVREAAMEAQQAVEQEKDLTRVMELTLQRARSALARTPSLLPILRQAGVVDSGGQGLVYILEGMWRWMAGLPVEDGAEKEAPKIQAHTEELEHEEHGYGYDVQFIIVGRNLDVERIRATIDSMGDSTLVVGDSNAVKVHVHVPDPGVPISYAVTLGSLRDVVVEDMQAQYEEFSAQGNFPAGMGPAMAMPTSFDAEIPSIGVVAVVAGEGLVKTYRSLGVGAIVEGGQTMNPSTADLIRAAESLPSDKVLILCNNKNIVLAAQQAEALCETKEIAVVPTRSVQQGIAALLAMDQEADLQENVERMMEAARSIISAEVTTATRDVELNGVQVRSGQAIGLLNGELLEADETYDAVVKKLLTHVDLDERELITLYYGEGTTAEEAQALLDELQALYPDLEFELVYGGQPHYPYFISIE